MKDCSYLLFEALLSKYPFVPSALNDEEATQRYTKAHALARQFPDEYRHTVFELEDSLDILSFGKAHHAFLLGLDLGLSISSSLEPFQDERFLMPP